MTDDDSGFLLEDYRFTAELLRRYTSKSPPMVPGGVTEDALFQATCSNNLNIILSALDKAGEEKLREPEPLKKEQVGGHFGETLTVSTLTKGVSKPLVIVDVEENGEEISIYLTLDEARRLNGLLGRAVVTLEPVA